MEENKRKELAEAVQLLLNKQGDPTGEVAGWAQLIDWIEAYKNEEVKKEQKRIFNLFNDTKNFKQVITNGETYNSNHSMVKLMERIYEPDSNKN